MADMTNYERIKNMTIHEIVDLIIHNYRCRKCAYYNRCCNGECEQGIKEWLESEAK